MAGGLDRRGVDDVRAVRETEVGDDTVRDENSVRAAGQLRFGAPEGVLLRVDSRFDGTACLFAAQLEKLVRSGPGGGFRGGTGQPGHHPAVRCRGDRRAASDDSCGRNGRND
ncbi:hypothetical protein GCM10027360_93180 [Amycolatopsis echigonensis]